MMSLENFEQIVDTVLENLPLEFAVKLDNVAITVEKWPTPADLKSIKAHPGTLLFGLYRGVPQTQRGNYSAALPDKIVVFASPILIVSKDADDAKRRIRQTVLHEIGHHFGMSEQQIRKAEKEG